VVIPGISRAQLLSAAVDNVGMSSNRSTETSLPERYMLRIKCYWRSHVLAVTGVTGERGQTHTEGPSLRSRSTATWRQHIPSADPAAKLVPITNRLHQVARKPLLEHGQPDGFAE
jgi:hypothetical protein